MFVADDNDYEIADDIAVVYMCDDSMFVANVERIDRVQVAHLVMHE